MRSGANPVILEYETEISLADAILEKARNTPLDKHSFTLEMHSGKSSIVAKNLLILPHSPGQNRNRKRIVVADRRFLWRNKIIIRAFNIRRRGSITRRLKTADGPLPIEVAPRVFDIDYKKLSLRPPNFDGKWTMRDIFESVLNEVTEGRFDRNSLRLLDNLDKNYPVENIEIDEDGISAIEHLLASFPGVGLYLDYNGIAKVYDQLSGDESLLVKSSGGEFQGSHADFVDFGISRPSKIRCLFTKEHEVRFDFADFGPESTDTPLEDRGPDFRFMENVLPIPDPTLDVVRGDQTVTLIAGTYISFDEVLSSTSTAGDGAWNQTQGKISPQSINITKQTIREDWVVNGLAPFWAKLGLLVPDFAWQSRVSAIKQHFRQTFRINPFWAERVRRISAERVSIIDPENGIRAPAPVYAGVSVMPTEQGLIKRQQDGGNASFIINVPSFTDNKYLVNGAALAPGDVRLLNGDMGILRIDYKVDPYGHSGSINPSLVSATPVYNPASSNATIAANQLRTTEGVRQVAAAGGVIKGVTAGGVTLSATHRVAVILTMVPGFPNNKNQLFAIDIEPKDVGIKGAANGPVVELRVGPNVATARFAWSDNDADSKTIEQSMGLIQEQGAVLDDDELNLRLNKLLVNGGDASRQGDLNEIAKAYAFQYYAKIVDRWLGTKETQLLPGQEPLGSVTSINHRLAPTGRFSSFFELPEKLEEQSVLAALDDNTRSILLKQVSQDIKR